MKSEFKRMYETRSVRPYYTIAHLGLLGKRLKEFIGFEYKKTVYIVSKDMHNSAYFDVREMDKAGKYFAKIWQDEVKVKGLLANVRETFNKAVVVEEWGWKQNWNDKKISELLLDAEHVFETMFRTFTRMFISQPQHVKPLEEKITKLLESCQNQSSILRRATYFPGQLPWSKEEKELEEANKKWPTLSKQEQGKILKRLAKTYGWFNEIEGERPFDESHYRKKILTFEKREDSVPRVSVPEDIGKVGRLIGELGFLRFWNRYHFMHLRYHLKKILQELVKRSGNPALEFATVSELKDFFQAKIFSLDEIHKRKEGYVAVLKNGVAELLVGKEAGVYEELFKENVSAVSEVQGSIANKGKVRGSVRVISFTAPDYNEQVVHFKRGEVLVTGMTRPQIVHLCQKAAAIVTDEGGITSHAAVVSREFNIPCIIATHNATKILKTGDLVEVDAERGIVKRL